MTTGIPDPKAVLEQLEEIKRQYLEAQTEVASVRATGYDQSRQVSVTVLGLGEVSDVTIDPAAANPADVDSLQQKILQAFRSANNQARDRAAQILSPLNISLPEPEPEPSAPAPALAAPSLSAPSLSATTLSLSPDISLTPALASAGPEPAPPLPGLSLHERPGSEAEETPEPQPQQPSLAHYQHYRPRW